MKIDCSSLPNQENLLKFVEIVKSNNPEIKIDLNSISALFLFMKTAQGLFSLAEKHFSKFNVSKGKFNVLKIIYLHSLNNEDEGISLSEIAKSAWVSKSTITGLIDGLENDGFVRRGHSSKNDRRKIVVELTAKGNEFLENFFPKHFQVMSKLLEDFTEKETQDLKVLMTKFLQIIEKNKEK